MPFKCSVVGVLLHSETANVFKNNSDPLWHCQIQNQHVDRKLQYSTRKIYSGLPPGPSTPKRQTLNLFSFWEPRTWRVDAPQLGEWTLHILLCIQKLWTASLSLNSAQNIYVEIISIDLQWTRTKDRYPYSRNIRQCSQALPNTPSPIKQETQLFYMHACAWHSTMAGQT